ncbi:MAG TPA: universal stress protein [Rhodanobacteraceae bacterium]|nr:universal stress protein [Rhodanobacteraceae bacterium]
MAPLDVLIHLRRIDTTTPAVRVGLSLAARLEAWTTGIHVVAVAPAAFASPEAVALQVHEAEGMVDEAKARAGWWREELAARSIAGEWQVAEGETVDVLCHAARWSDLVVVERPQLNPDAPTGWGLVSRTVFGSSAPVVVVPDTAASDTAGARIVVAWNRSREATRAIHGALPLLRRAERLLVLEGEPVENPFGLRRLPQLDLRAWLARHGVSAEFRDFKPTAKERGAALLDTAHAEAADLIVMGAWGHSRITELVLGGTTRHVFQSSDLPLLVAH